MGLNFEGFLSLAIGTCHAPWVDHGEKRSWKNLEFFVRCPLAGWCGYCLLGGNTQLDFGGLALT